VALLLTRAVKFVMPLGLRTVTRQVSVVVAADLHLRPVCLLL
jgi:hypothetical protein